MNNTGAPHYVHTDMHHCLQSWSGVYHPQFSMNQQGSYYPETSVLKPSNRQRVHPYNNNPVQSRRSTQTHHLVHPTSSFSQSKEFSYISPSFRRPSNFTSQSYYQSQDMIDLGPSILGSHDSPSLGSSLSQSQDSPLLGSSWGQSQNLLRHKPQLKESPVNDGSIGELNTLSEHYRSVQENCGFPLQNFNCGKTQNPDQRAGMTEKTDNIKNSKILLQTLARLASFLNKINGAYISVSTARRKIIDVHKFLELAPESLKKSTIAKEVVDKVNTEVFNKINDTHKLMVSDHNAISRCNEASFAAINLIQNELKERFKGSKHIMKYIEDICEKVRIYENERLRENLFLENVKKVHKIMDWHRFQNSVLQLPTASSQLELMLSGIHESKTFCQETLHCLDEKIDSSGKILPVKGVMNFNLISLERLTAFVPKLILELKNRCCDLKVFEENMRKAIKDQALNISHSVSNAERQQ